MEELHAYKAQYIVKVAVQGLDQSCPNHLNVHIMLISSVRYIVYVSKITKHLAKLILNYNPVCEIQSTGDCTGSW
jgi:hypothetical protein